MFKDDAFITSALYGDEVSVVFRKLLCQERAFVTN